MRVAIGLGIAFLMGCGLEAAPERERAGNPQHADSSTSASLPTPVIAGIRIGDSPSRLEMLGPPTVTERDGAFLMQAWELDGGNSLHVASSESTIIFIELDWGGGAASSPLPGMMFGGTSLRDLDRLLGGDIGYFHNVPCVASGENIGWLRGKEIDGVQMAFVVSVPRAALPVESVPLDRFKDRAMLNAVMLATPQYAIELWGDRGFDDGFDATPSAALWGPVCGYGR